MNADPTLLGTVEDVSGASIRIKLGQATVSGLSFIEGQSYRIGHVLVKGDQHAWHRWVQVRFPNALRR